MATMAQQPKRTETDTRTREKQGEKHGEKAGAQQRMELFDPSMEIRVQIPKLQTKMFIDNKWTDPEKRTTFKTINPATGEKICDVAEAHAEDVDRAVQAARRAFRGWSHMTGTKICGTGQECAFIIISRRCAESEAHQQAS